MQNLFICKFSVLKIQFFPSVSVLPSSRAPLSFHPPRHPASFLVGTRLLDLGGTRALVHAAWYGEGLADEPNGMCAAFRTGKPGVAERMRSAGCSVRECGLSRTIIIFGDCAGGRLLSNLYPEKVLPRRLRAQDTLGRESTRRAQDPLRRERTRRVQDTLGRERTRRSQNLFEACAHQTGA